MAGWIGVDLDGTLAHFDRWRGPRHIGLPIPAMAKRVHDWHSRGVEVRIFTARASRPELIPDVQDWLKRHGFPPLAVTNQKDFGMVELWDDRAIQVLYNTGKAVRPSRLEEVEKAELFDPDAAVVYADEEQDNEVEPTPEEVEKFKRNIKATSDSSLNSLDDLLDALDDGEYAPGDSEALIPDAAPELPPAAEPAKPTTDLAPPKSAAALTVAAAIEEPETDLPLDPQGFVSEKFDVSEELIQPKNALVEINLDSSEMNLDDVGDITAEFKTVPAVEVEDVDFAPLPDITLDETVADENLDPTPNETLENQPLTEAPDPLFDDEDRFNLDASLDDFSDDIKTPIITRQSNQDRAPQLTVFPDDDLDDLHDLPTFKVERR